MKKVEYNLATIDTNLSLESQVDLDYMEAKGFRLISITKVIQFAHLTRYGSNRNNDRLETWIFRREIEE